MLRSRKAKPCVGASLSAGPGSGRVMARQQHGLVRTVTWQTESVSSDQAVLRYETDGTHPLFPHRAAVRLTVSLKDKLQVNISTTNNGAEPLRLNHALHTYLSVGDISRTVIHGVEQQPMIIQAEIDRLYTGIPGPLRVDDKAIGRVIKIVNSSDEVQMWNPGPTKLPRSICPQRLTKECFVSKPLK